MKLMLRNDFHGTKTTAITRNGMLSPQQVKRIKKDLCCTDCKCSGELGVRGKDAVTVSGHPLDYKWNVDGMVEFWTRDE